ncbi:hypothetical protein JCM33374_g454 [Metschnikowia sp. JCM 33374]|nr:hypothetical protein JCM33374_g454 [Metschnikowia sp. JCM 33374]
MDSEKDFEVGSHTQPTNPIRSYVKIDLRLISLLTFLSGLASVVVISVSMNANATLVRKVALGGALQVLTTAKKVSYVVAVATIISRVSFGLGRIVEILPRSSAGVTRSLLFAIVLTFAHGGLEEVVYDMMWITEDICASIMEAKAEEAAKVAAAVSTGTALV